MNKNKSPFHNMFNAFFQKSTRTRFHLGVIVLSYVVAFVIILFMVQSGDIFHAIKPDRFQTGDIAQQDIVVKRDVVYVDENATQVKLEAMRELVYPVFRIDNEVTREILSKYEDFSSRFLREYHQDDSPRTLFLKMQTAFPGLFTEEEIRTLLALENTTEIVPLTYTVLQQLLEQGIVRYPDDSGDIRRQTIEIWDRTNNQRDELEPSAVVTMENLATAVQERVEGKDVDAGVVAMLASKFATPNAFYDKQQTERLREEVVRDVEPVVKKIRKGEKIVQAGEVVTDEDITQLKMLQKSSATANVYSIVSILLFLFLLYVLAYILFSPIFIKEDFSTENLYLLTGMFILYLGVAFVVEQFLTLPGWLPFSVMLPTSLFAMLVSILINNRTAIIYSLLLSLLVFLFNKTSLASFLFAFFSGVAGTLLVTTGAQKRIDLIKATLYLTVTSSVLVSVFVLIGQRDVTSLLYAAGLGALNGFLCGFITVSILPIFEHVLNAPTSYRLMELADTNSPMLKRMLTLAPGTYSHSLNVANLAESACREIGANAVLARVGAFYHDIGKIDQPEYFIENQRSDNKHDYINPSLSVAVIKSHVKIGIERAKELKLPKAVIDIIAQHHGSGLISYFYSEALKNNKSKEVLPEDYSYSESPPKTKEAAVVMLADTVDAATRTLKKPSIAKLEKTVWDIIMQRFKEKQLNDCELTFKDLEIIKKTFVQILAGYFHSRIEYPRLEAAAQ